METAKGNYKLRNPHSSRSGTCYHKSLQGIMKQHYSSEILTLHQGIHRLWAGHTTNNLHGIHMNIM